MEERTGERTDIWNYRVVSILKKLAAEKEIIDNMFTYLKSAGCEGYSEDSDTHSSIFAYL